MSNVIKANFKIKKVKEKDNYGKFVLEPLDQGYGHTVGNALRRSLLSSMAGAAITRVKIDGISHQFSTLKGLREDIVDLILNLKQIRLKYEGDKEVKAVLEAKGNGEVTAASIKAPPGVEIVNQDLKLATLADKNSKLSLKLWINKGFGYSPAEERKSDTLGVIPIDALFTPVVRVNYQVESTRVGGRTDFDKLILEIWTDGTVKPKKALENGAEILTSFFKQIYNPVYEKEKETKAKVKDNEVLKLTVEELNLPTRIANALRQGGYGTVGDLTKAKKEEVAKVKNLGKKSIVTIVEKLIEKGVKINNEA
ncbi:DNA-directed RNA polymerase subunit alpha [Candidatus Beckwithbacteria bacterium CG10_big_fil_rev_8_21_14_0_10_34_10]|uniref:DNA-directed RNA polymerase subunit alpha n=1 Tax=Candidatus Beckwithbacteria bacterium CG10_big_fil_rev_8_21_14_0_10_34_10 TaxID=1974495 RepID=A0A2H0W7T5_9BACT|nr:MAG: DNA-directed RNA polymerase subunit alpha [Candidatus Beckwithbacteria bacterium CG10_big_fil_rev_8_21_14_0_10_34_10]